MQVDALAPRLLLAKLADRLEERQALDVAHRAAHLAQHEVIVLVAVGDEFLMASVTCGITCTVAPR
jgi:flagellar biogenesis protein FliO